MNPILICLMILAWQHQGAKPSEKPVKKVNC